MKTISTTNNHDVKHSSLDTKAIILIIAVVTIVAINLVNAIAMV